VFKHSFCDVLGFRDDIKFQRVSGHLQHKLLRIQALHNVTVSRTLFFFIFAGGPKLVYLNCSIRGYPLGIRAGSDPRKPSIAIDGDFNKFHYKNIPYGLDSIEVWGCGLPEER